MLSCLVFETRRSKKLADQWLCGAGRDPFAACAAGIAASGGSHHIYRTSEGKEQADLSRGRQVVLSNDSLVISAIADLKNLRIQLG